ncbi:hypothetical protein NCPPB3778_53 [Rathayibacter phage NCPPB3778]|nr:hypothetical protein NCPPB3778_53 [Rathayibacter phage NCPPB3778]
MNNSTPYQPKRPQSVAQTVATMRARTQGYAEDLEKEANH